MKTSASPLRRLVRNRKIRMAVGLSLAWVFALGVGCASFIGITSFADILGIGPLVGPGHVDSFNVSCGATATIIQSPFGQVSYNGFVDDSVAVDVFFGDSAVTTALGTPKGAGEEIGGNVRKEYCIVASGSETLHVRALTATEQSSIMGSFRMWLTKIFEPEVWAAHQD